MSRLFLLWSTPPEWTQGDSETWAQRTAWRLRQADGVDSVEIVPLTSAAGHPLWYEWLAVIDVTPVGTDEEPGEVHDVVQELRGCRADSALLRQA